MAFHWPKKALELHVTVKTDDEIIQLRAKVAELEAQLEAERQLRHRAEFRYGCECRIKAELVDLCRASKVDFRASLNERPW